MSRIEASLGDYKGPPIPVYVAGGAATHIYTGSRFSGDIDAVLGRRLLLPQNLEAMYRDSAGKLRLVYFDRQYNDTPGLMHEDTHDDSVPIEVPGVNGKRLAVRVLSPVDLAVSKLARFAEPDQEDIKALARFGLLDAKALRRRAEEALSGYTIGNLTFVRISIDQACKIVDEINRAGRSE